MNGRTNVTDSKVNDLQIPLDPCTNLVATAGNGQVRLSWTDPLDMYATPEGTTAQDSQQLVAKWSHTLVVRNTDHQPENPDDGTIILMSSVRNQYQTNGYVDNTVENGTLYYYGLFAISTANVTSAGSFTSATPIVGTPLSDLAVGTLVKMNIDGAPWEWRIVHQGLPGSMYDQSCDGCWLLLDKIYNNRQWNSSNDNNYATSTVKAYLDSTFLNKLDSGILAQVKQVKIPYLPGTLDGPVNSGANGLSCKIFLVSGTEVACYNYDVPDNEGAELSYFAMCAADGPDSKRVAYINNRAAKWWLRSASMDYSQHTSCVVSDGDISSRASSESLGIRPALILPSTALVDQDLNLIEKVA